MEGRRLCEMGMRALKERLKRRLGGMRQGRRMERKRISFPDKHLMSQDRESEISYGIFKNFINLFYLFIFK